MRNTEKRIRYSSEDSSEQSPEQIVDSFTNDDAVALHGSIHTRECEPGIVEIRLQEIPGIGLDAPARRTAKQRSGKFVATLHGKPAIRQRIGKISANGKIPLNDSARPVSGRGNIPLLRLYDAQEEVAKRIAQRLHDESAQMLAVIYLELAEIARECPDPVARKIAGVVENLDVVSEQLRQLSHELRPRILDQLGLMAGLNFLADGVRKRSGLDINVTGNVDRTLPRKVATVLYRVVQEALSNVVRHACATRVEVRVWKNDSKVFCSVSDDGSGFQMADGNEGAVSGLGLIGINERVVALDGDCKIFSRKGKGTDMQVEIPL